MDFKFFEEHFKAACGALMVPRAVVGNHWSNVMFPNLLQVEEKLPASEGNVVSFQCHFYEALALPLSYSAPGLICLVMLNFKDF